MLITYEEFYELLTDHIHQGDEFYFSLLKNVIDNPSRYCGLFRLSNARSKLIQNVTQSREIKFGDIIEELTTKYIERLGYKNFDKNLGKDADGDSLVVDQLFTDGKTIFLVEMKMRDDHDASKKRGQFENFKKKIIKIRDLYTNSHITAIMWFVDDSLVKNKNYYQQEIAKEKFNNVSLHLYYGGDFFKSLKNGKGVVAWQELTLMLKEYRRSNANNNDVEIPDFGTSEQIYKALLKLPQNYWNKLTSDKREYDLLRKELFSAGDNLEKAMISRMKLQNKPR